MLQTFPSCGQLAGTGQGLRLRAGTNDTRVLGRQPRLPEVALRSGLAGLGATVSDVRSALLRPKLRAVVGEQCAGELLASQTDRIDVVLSHRTEVGGLTTHGFSGYQICNRNGEPLVCHAEISVDEPINEAGGGSLVQTATGCVLGPSVQRHQSFAGAWTPRSGQTIVAAVRGQHHRRLCS